MSILVRLITEDIFSLFRKAPRKYPDSSTPIGSRSNVKKDMSETLGVTRRPSGLKVAILNWKAGENDPFTVVNRTISQHLRACGKNVEIIEISVDDWPAKVVALAREGIEFAYTWQGLGSAVTIGQHSENLWDHLRVPLICIHGDHPSHMPRNHELESRYCFHLYANSEFARYSNRHFRRYRSASVIDIPILHREARLRRPEGDYFVIAKNVNHPTDIENYWQQRVSATEFRCYMSAAETLKALVTREPYVEVHEVLDDLIRENGWEWLVSPENISAYHQYHSQIDRYVRSHKSVLAVTTLYDFPVHVYGRGWERIARTGSPNHAFSPGRDMADSQYLFYSRFGVVDISPSKGLHDRTRRAMANGTGFVSSANLEDSFPDLARFGSLFYTFTPGDLQKKCEAVLRDPDGHSELARMFADTYHTRFNFRDFVRQIEGLARLACAF
jgi:hypothetical protein